LDRMEWFEGHDRDIIRVPGGAGKLAGPVGAVWRRIFE